MNAANPFVQFDAEGEMFGIGASQEPPFRTFGVPSRIKKTTGYFIIYFTGPRKDLQFPITKQIFELIERQMRGQNSLLSKGLGPGA
jgi:hypothetical protein